ncbi:MAG: type II toxin-antitoxin system YafQ family toxin [Oscillospiraceae bacterium]|nr:type II toxin-antitoxin system YafQ family toxin [Oscillospiraceae bacterium]
MLDDIERHNQYKRDYKLIKKQNRDISLLKAIVIELFNENPLPPKNNDHFLIGDYKGYRECHILPDWLLIYKIIERDNEKILILARTGSHSDLFE